MSIDLDENLVQEGDVVTCRHCQTQVGAQDDPVRDARVRESEPGDAGPSVHEDASHFTDRVIVFRQVFCPGCLTLLQAEIVPADEAPGRTRSVKQVST